MEEREFDESNQYELTRREERDEEEGLKEVPVSRNPRWKRRWRSMNSWYVYLWKMNWKVLISHILGYGLVLVSGLYLQREAL